MLQSYCQQKQNYIFSTQQTLLLPQHNTRASKLQSMGQIQPAELFHPACEAILSVTKK